MVFVMIVRYQQVPDGFRFTTDYHTEFREDSEDRGQVVPHGLKAEVIFEQLCHRQPGRYIEQGRRPHHVKHPSFLDLTSVIPDCKIYLAFSSNSFKYGRKYFKATKIKRFDLLCDFISNERIDYATLEELVYGLSSFNEESTDGRLPLVEACRCGNSQVVELLLREGANKNVGDRKGMIPYIEAVCSGKLRPEIMPQLMPNDAKNLTWIIAMNPQAIAHFARQEKNWVLEEITKLKRTLETVCNDKYNADELENLPKYGHLLQGVTTIFQANRLQKSPKRVFSGDTSSRSMDFIKSPVSL
ncbi:uncharacterized protein LOC9643090 [Selaginella moellendorffii]|uniref:uncharacterized protein LOC9643090 n=1 Tax=Selaginella moellendorffii TaxID=88036 RepID=UPI000D1D09BE|nr:uncharacterized protein LOC9643090 [Selaginella moellendorffii]|eukprot:XP_024531168.1 uncharacterized protein LOC9643090 [Selaginella moellendorffii]